MNNMIVIMANKIAINIDDRGYIADIADPRGVSLFPLQEAPFVRVGVAGKLLCPVTAKMNNGEIAIEMEGGYKVYIDVIQKKGYSVIAVKEISDECDTLIFGPYPTVLGETVGEVVGVVRAKGFAIGVQALNIKTIGGFPIEYKEEIYKEYEIDKNVSQVSVGPIEYCRSAAYKTRFGSILQLYCNDRSRGRKRTVLNKTNVPVPPMSADDPDSKIKGAAFAIFGCDEDEVLSVIERIELAEGLPHPTIEGEWVKTSKKATRSYLIAEFNENNFDKILGCAIAAGFKNIYHPEPFSNWGHFHLREDCFPSGDMSLVEMSKRAAEKGVGIGLHTLTNFTTTNDPYVTPVPHPDLAVCGQTFLLCDIGLGDDMIVVSEKEIFEEPSFLSTIRIDDELIQYSDVLKNEKGFILSGCKRGAFGTIPYENKTGAMVKKFSDHDYNV